MQQEREDRVQQTAHGQQMERMRLESDLVGGRQAEQRKYEEGVKSGQREQDIADADKKFRRSLFTYAAEQGSITPELLEAIGESVSPEERSVLESISSTSKKKYEDERSADRQKGTKKFTPADLSTLKADLVAGFGFEPAPEAIQAIAAKMDETGVPASYAASLVYPDPAKIPRAKESSPKQLKNATETLGTFAEAYPEKLAEAKKAGIDPMSIVSYMQPTQENPEGEKPLDAYRHATADMIAESLAQEIGSVPRVSTAKINEVLQRNTLHPISEETAEYSLTGIIDELLKANVATTAGKGTDLNVIREIVLEALGAPRPTSKKTGPALSRERMGMTPEQAQRMRSAMGR